MEEVYAPLRERLWLMIILVGALLGGAGASVGFVWRQQRSRFYQEQYKSAEALRASNERLQLALESANSGAWEWDLLTNENIWSDDLWILYGLEPHSCVPSYEAWVQTIHPDDKESTIKKVQEAALKGSELNAEWRVIDRDGSVRWLMSRGRPLRDANGSAVRFMGIVLDITDRKRAEEALRASGEKFRAIFENNSSALAIIERDTTIFMVNDAYCQMSGYTKEEVIGMSWTQQISPEDLERLKEYNRRRLINPDDAPDKYEFKFYKKSGEIRHGLMFVSLLQSSRQIITSFVDITDRINAEEEREKIINELKTALADVKTLSGLLPICSSCKKIRDDNGYWQQVEGYIQKHSDAIFTHGVCPDCMVKLYPEYIKDKEKRLKKK
jgi:PAS domain S-box-containing protein